LRLAKRLNPALPAAALSYHHRMTNPITMTLLVLLALAMMTGAASARDGTAGPRYRRAL
jgi:lipopolysaccharide export LptBFGC system permease protein LptF